MPALRSLVVRDDTSKNGSNITPTMMNLMITLVVLFVAICLLCGGLLILRAARRSKKASVEDDNEKPKPSGYRRLTIDTNTPAYVIQEKRNLIENSSSPPPSPLPEIRITFADEFCPQTGRPQSGRVVVVRMGESNAVGLEPVQDQCPPYESSGGARFQSLDLERMGGLKEKEVEKRYS